MQKLQDQQDRLQVSLLYQIKSQLLRAWQPVPSLAKTIILFILLSIIFLGIGIPMIIYSNDIIQEKVRYDNKCTINTNCTIQITINTLMKQPIFIYYEINNFYQNHRLYAKSLSSKQLKGQLLSQQDISKYCYPIILNKDLIYINKSIDGNILNPQKVANPCGLIAWTIFNDTFSIKSSKNKSFIIQQSNIAWPSDIEKYKLSNISQQWINTTSQRFINWMRIAAMSNFRKVWGRIQQDIQPQIYYITINNNYNISAFGGTKYFVMSTSNFFGSKNQFLAYIYISIGLLCLIISIAFLVKRLFFKNKIL